ncbi:hypothetical protein MmiAt1_11390 [Methanimicrococcus sp. At1]|uniref:Type II secretion system protein GspF domain-containing protein n=1 Tax=Methanimicrococcus hacksteinii TaxID=3028293 RepID=A0ABU3VRM6_9EURY|nr:type II secretion system F family protein [Methanimicrococcus sp. At1]MDV0445555.1 hypothetical protein [Methanimicrococcus sp. At1]
MISNPPIRFVFKTAYRFFGKTSEEIRLPFLGKNLKKSRMYFPESLYLSVMFFVLSAVTILWILAEAAVFIFKTAGGIEPETADLISVFVFAGFIFAILFIAVLFYFIPYFKAYDRKIKIEQQLPFAVNYMAAMTFAGIPTSEIFAAVSQNKLQTVYKELSAEMKNIELQVHVFGEDYPAALQKTANETVSPLFSDFLAGAKNTMVSGGSFQKFIHSKKHEYRSLAARRKEKYFQTLEMFSEIYLTVFLAMPLFFMILFYTLAPLSGPQTEQMKMLTYQIVPFLGIFFLLILEIMNEKEDL